MHYRTVVSGKRFVEKAADTGLLQSQQDQAVAKLQELASNLEAVLKEYAPTRLGMYEAPNGVIFSEVLEHFGYILNRVDEPVPVLKAPIGRYRSEEHTSELQSLMRISYAVFCLQKNT